MKKLALTLGAALGGLALCTLMIDPAFAQAAEPAAPAPTLSFNKADDAWMMVSSLLVLMMTVPGLALFYGGMVRTKNMLSMVTQVLAIQCIVCVVWFLWGYSLTFTEGSGFLAPFFGGLSKAFLSGIEIGGKVETFSLGVGIHELVFVCFQMTFAAITTALAIGGFAERTKFSAIVLFAILWPTLVYFPVAHMVWAGSGLIFNWGALDFAGGTVVHINAGVAALVGCLMIGKRAGFPREMMAPHSMTLTMVGASLLWVGWFGFNAGSNLEATGTATLAMINTFVATAAAGLSWMVFEWMFKWKASLLGLVSGVVAGLVAVTPAAGFIGPLGAAVLGGVAGAVCLFFCAGIKRLFGYDDSLDVFGIHCIGGILGAIGTGLLVSPEYGGTGILDYASKPGTAVVAEYVRDVQLIAQLKAVGLTLAWSGIGTAIIFKVVDVVIGTRVDETAERQGLDLTEHGERGYVYDH